MKQDKTRTAVVGTAVLSYDDRDVSSGYKKQLRPGRERIGSDR